MTEWQTGASVVNYNSCCLCRLNVTVWVCVHREFLLQKRVENRLEKQFPEKFRSMYAMVVYGGGGNITYSNALKLGSVQQILLRELIEDLLEELEGLEEGEWSGQLDAMADRVNMTTAEELIDSRLVSLQAELGVDLSTISH